MRILGYLLIGLSAALFSAPVSPLPRIGHRVRYVSLRATSRRAMTLEFITILADQLRVGSAPLQAFCHAASIHPLLGIEMEPRGSHEECLSIMRGSAIDGSEALLKVALFMDLSHHRGAPLIPALDAIATSIEGELALEEELLNEIASARATAVLMSLLPILIVLALHPFHFLFGTVIGRICLTAAVFLNLIGRFWLARITRSALAVTS